MNTELPDASLRSPSPPPNPVIQGDVTGGIIPYKNPQALLAYYLGLFSMFPCLGLLLSIPAVILGMRGLSARRKQPVIKGSVHAWIGIIMGTICTLVWAASIISVIFIACLGPRL